MRLSAGAEADGFPRPHLQRYLDLEPVLAPAAKRDGWRAAALDYSPGPEEEARNLSRSIWVAMAKDEATLMTLRIATGEDAHRWRSLRGRPGFPGWTDDYASILPLLEDWHAWLPGVLKP